jgi:hypothetical protein
MMGKLDKEYQNNGYQTACAAQLNLYQAQAGSTAANAKKLLDITQALQRIQDEATMKFLEQKAAGDQRMKFLKEDTEKVWNEIQSTFCSNPSNPK